MQWWSIRKALPLSLDTEESERLAYLAEALDYQHSVVWATWSGNYVHSLVE